MFPRLSSVFLTLFLDTIIADLFVYLQLPFDFFFLLHFARSSVASDSSLLVQLCWTNVHHALHKLRHSPPQVGILAKVAGSRNP